MSECVALRMRAHGQSGQGASAGHDEGANAEIVYPGAASVRERPGEAFAEKAFLSTDLENVSSRIRSTDTSLLNKPYAMRLH